MKIGFVSLGCPKNLVDSEVMIGLSQRAGHAITADPAEADVLVVNTCSFIEPARRESVAAILEMAAFKKSGRCRRLVVTGCLSERYRDELLAEVPEIDALVGTGDVAAIVSAVEGTPTSPTAGPWAPPGYLPDPDTPRTLSTPRHYAYLKLGEGCDHACAFCIIPRIRGPYRSRPTEEILLEARRLARRGVRELILISQDTTFYGRDRGEADALGRLLRELNRVDGLAWIRLLYLHPSTISDDLLATMASGERICKYVDLPLQHAASSVLRRMKRHGGRTTYDRLLSRIRARVPGVAIRTSFIVGFPGETEAEFTELLRFVRDQAFDHVGVFTYSHEQGTAAWALDDDVPARVKHTRQRRLMALQKQKVSRALKTRIGERGRILVDGSAAEHDWVLKGRLESQAPEIDSMVYLTDADPVHHRPGQLLEIEIVGSRGYDLVARPLS